MRSGATMQPIIVCSCGYRYSFASSCPNCHKVDWSLAPIVECVKGSSVLIPATIKEKAQIAAAAHAINEDLTILMSMVTGVVAKAAVRRIANTAKRMLAYAVSMEDKK